MNRSSGAGPLYRSKVTELSRDLPLSFERNRGQANDDVKFLSRGPGYCLLLKPTEVALHIAPPASSDRDADNSSNLSLGANSAPSCGFNQPPGISMPPPHSEPADIRVSTRDKEPTVVRMKLVGGRSPLNIAGLDELACKSNYVVGSDARNWRTNVANYSRVKYRGVYRGVDMIYYGHQGHLEYDFVVAPGARADRIRLSFEGTDKLTLDAKGDLVLATSAGEIRQHKPTVYQYVNGERTEVDAEYVINRDSEVGFRIAEYDSSRELIIDPVLTYSTYLGSGLGDRANSIAVDGSGNVYVTGLTSSLNFPTTPGAPQSSNRSVPGVIHSVFDVFVAKLSTTGAGLIHSTYIGGAGDDVGNGIAVDESGNAFVVGSTTSPDFPTTQGAYQPSNASNVFIDELLPDAFVFALNPEGAGLVYSTYLGGRFHDVAEGLALNTAGDVYVTGFSNSSNFPTTPDAFQRTNGGLGGAFITKLDRSGARLVYSTLLRGADGHGIAIDSTGNAYVAGSTRDDLPATDGAFIEFVNDPYSGFVAKLNPMGSALVYATFLAGKEFGSDEANAIAVDSQGCAYVTGLTNSPDFPTTDGAIQKHKAKSPYTYISDAFVLKLNPEGTEVIYSTYLGGNATDSGNAIALDSQGCAYVAGYAPSVNFPVANAVQKQLNGGPLLSSSDGGETWGILSVPGSAATAMRFQPGDPATFYVAADEGLFKTKDGGQTWAPFGPVENPIGYYIDLQIDPRNPSTMFFSYISDLFRSTDGGGSWAKKTIDTILISGVTVDPVNTSTVYLATFNDLRKSTDGGNTWNLTPLVREPDSGLSPLSREAPFVYNLLIDPLNTSTLYAGTYSGIFKSTDGARTWTRLIVDPARPIDYLRGIDPRNTSTLYAMVYSTGPFDVYKSVDGGSTWQVIGQIDDGAGTLSIDPANPSVMYANTYAGQLRSTDGGVSWNPLPLGNLSGNVSIHPQSFALYFTTQIEADAFVAKVSQDGTSLMSSTYLGGYGYDSALGVAVDLLGNVYATGESWSANFPTRTGAFSVSYGGGAQDSFIIKFGAPKITGASINHKALSVAGENFDKEAVILLNGKQQKTERDGTSQMVVLTSRKAGKRIAAGEQVVIQVKNSDGTLSQQFSFTRPAGL